MKVDKKVRKDLEKIAQRLPQLDREGTQKTRLINGSQAMEAGITTTKDGEMIRPDSKLSVETGPIPVNHVRKMKKIWGKAKSLGEANMGISNYCKEVVNTFIKKSPKP